MHQCQIRKDNHISMFNGILPININHFVSVFIHIEQHTVETYDSYHTEKGISECSTESDDDSDSKEDVDTETVVLMGKWIAKSIWSKGFKKSYSKPKIISIQRK